MISTAISGLVSSAISDKGLSEKRPVNEDSYLEMTDRGLFAVADGVGGAQAGDVASQMAMEVLFEAFSHPQPNVDNEELMEMAIQRANQAIFQMSHELPQLDMMATTIVALHLHDNVATIGHVGDSRLYRIDARGNLFRETQDHSVVEEEVRAGRMTVSQAAHHPSRNVISRALGAENTVEVDMKTIMYEPGTTFLLCSDGVTRHLEDAEIRAILMRDESPVELCGEIKDICYARGAEDNLTAVIVRIEGDSQQQQFAPTSDYDDEATLTGIRPPVSPANGLTSAYNGAPNTATTDEAFSVDDDETILASEHETLKPESRKIFDKTEPVTADSFASAAATAPIAETAIPTKLESERLQTKADAVESFPSFERIPPETGSGIGKILTYLLILLVGAALGAGLLFWLMGGAQQPAQTPAQPTSQNAPGSQKPLVVSDLTQQEANEYISYERIRRRFDDNPIVAPNTAPPQSAADFYLRGRAFLQTGRYEDALASLKTAQEGLADARDVDRETLRVDVALALAAVAAMANNAAEERMLGDLIKEKQAAAASTNTQIPAP